MMILRVEPACIPDLKLQLLVFAWYILTQTIVFAIEKRRIGYT